jgi:hypothetical protein
MTNVSKQVNFILRISQKLAPTFSNPRFLKLIRKWALTQAQIKAGASLKDKWAYPHSTSFALLPTPCPVTHKVASLNTSTEPSKRCYFHKHVATLHQSFHWPRPPLLGGCGGGEGSDDRWRSHQKLRRRRKRHAGPEAYEPGVLKTQRCHCHSEMEGRRPHGPQVRAQPHRPRAPQAQALQTRPRGLFLAFLSRCFSFHSLYYYYFFKILLLAFGFVVG